LGGAKWEKAKEKQENIQAILTELTGEYRLSKAEETTARFLGGKRKKKKKPQGGTKKLGKQKSVKKNLVNKLEKNDKQKRRSRRVHRAGAENIGKKMYKGGGSKDPSGEDKEESAKGKRFTGGKNNLAA